MDAALLALQTSATQIAALIHQYRTADTVARDAHREDLIKAVKASDDRYGDEGLYYLTRFTGCWDEEQLQAAPPVLFTLFEVDRLQQELAGSIQKVQAVAKGEAGRIQKMNMISDECGFIDSEISTLKRLVEESYEVTAHQHWNLGGISWRLRVCEDEVGSCDFPRTSRSIEVLLPQPSPDESLNTSAGRRQRVDKGDEWLGRGQQILLYERVRIYQDSKETVTWSHEILQRVCDIANSKLSSTLLSPKSLARLLAVVFFEFDGDYFIESYNFDREFR